MDFLDERNVCGQTIVKLVSRANAIIAELLRLSQFIPPVLRLDNQRDRQLYEFILPDFRYFNGSDYYEGKIDASIVREREREKEMESLFIIHYYCACGCGLIIFPTYFCFNTCNIYNVCVYVRILYCRSCRTEMRSLRRTILKSSRDSLKFLRAYIAMSMTSTGEGKKAIVTYSPAGIMWSLFILGMGFAFCSWSLYYTCIIVHLLKCYFYFQISH